MGKQATIQFGQSGKILLAALAWSCASTAFAAPLVTVPTSTLAQPSAGSASFAAVPAPAAVLPVLPAGLSQGSAAVSGAKSPATLPGFEGVSSTQGKESTAQAVTAPSGIRPIRIPPSILPVPLPILSGS